ncbi:MAG: hypothetical protein ACRC1K_13115, partial [Planctomycetia bacterium]
MTTPQTPEEDAVALKTAQDLSKTQRQQLHLGLEAQLRAVTPILRLNMQPSNVHPDHPGGPLNLKRVLNTLINDESAQIAALDEGGKSLGMVHFRQIYPQVQGPFRDRSIQIEYSEQATLGLLGDALWSMKWFFKHGVLGLPRQAVNSVLQNMGVSFMLELYYQKWLISLLDQLNQQGVLIGFVDPESKED